MKNKQRELDLISQTIEEKACYANPGPTAVASVKFIDETYILIPREDLPVVNYGSLDDALASGTSIARIANITENVYEGDTEKMRTLAYQYLAMASYVDAKKAKAEETKLTTLRAEAWKLLHPGSSLNYVTFSWQDCDDTERNAINAIVDLKRQLAKAEGKG